MDKIFDPSGVAAKGALFGLPYTLENADLVLIPVPWEVTTSYGAGTSHGPLAILEASSQVDLSLKAVFEPWGFKVAMQNIPMETLEQSNKLKSQASQIIEYLESSTAPMTPEMESLQEQINSDCDNLHQHIYRQAKELIGKGKIVAIVGGDHSTPLGLISALSEVHDFGILQFDAHMDLRQSFEGFTYSHASIMRNAIDLPGVKSLTQIGIRDFCQEELDFIEECQKEINVYYDEDIQSQLFNGENFSELVSQIVAKLPEKIYISFDIDGLDPSLCPNTGTPVPGGLSFNQAYFILLAVVQSRRTIIGFDLNEVSPGNDNWDANVGARLLYRLTTLTGVSNDFLEFAD
jgi:agmatinase